MSASEQSVVVFNGVGIPVQQGPNGKVGDNLIQPNGVAGVESAVHFQPTLPIKFPEPLPNGNGVAPGFAARMAARGSERVGRSWVAGVGEWTRNVLHVAVGVGGVACDVVTHAPAVVGATVRSIPDAAGLAVGPVDWLAARARQANADHWTTNSRANLGHDARVQAERAGAVASLSDGVLKGVMTFFSKRAANGVFNNSERLFTQGFNPDSTQGRAQTSAEWVATVAGVSRDMATRRARVANRYRLAVS